MSNRTKIRNALAAALLLATAIPASAQQSQNQLPDPENREKYINEVRRYKHDFMAKDLDLSREQQREFFPVYDAMEDELMKVNDETRELERNTDANADATDTELEAAAQAIFSQKQREGEIELEYFDKFRKILNNRQLLRLKNTERKFTQQLVRHHRRLSTERNAAESARKRQQ